MMRRPSPAGMPRGLLGRCGGRWARLRRRRGWYVERGAVGRGIGRGRLREGLGGRRGFRRRGGLALRSAELALFLLGKPVVFLPLLTQGLLLVRRQALELLIALARG